MPLRKPVGYTQPVEKHTRLASLDIHYITKPGLPAWDTITPASALLAEHTNLPTGYRALWLGCGHGAGAAALALRFPAAQLTLMDSSSIAVQMAQRTLQANQIANARILKEISTLTGGQNAFEVVLIELPKGRKLAQRWLAEAWYALRPNGQLFLSGANDQGVQSVIQDASQLFGPGTILGYRKGSRVVRWNKIEQLSNLAGSCEWLKTPGVAPGSWQRIAIESQGERLELVSLPGVFSYDQLDEGSALLLENLPALSNERICDLGCGYGVIGLLAARRGAAQVDLLDSNMIAIACARANLAAHNLTNARALASDVFSAVSGERYQRILSNPPFHSGKGVDYQMAHAFIEQSYQALEAGGELRLVANRFIRYEQIILANFKDVNIAAETGKYRILSAFK